jgi:hypothetical protein
MGLPGAAGPDRALLDPPAHPPVPPQFVAQMERCICAFALCATILAFRYQGTPWTALAVQRARCHNGRCRAAVPLLTMARPSQAAGVYEHLDPSEEARKSDLLPAPKESCGGDP